MEVVVNAEISNDQFGPESDINDYVLLQAGFNGFHLIQNGYLQVRNSAFQEGRTRARRTYELQNQGLHRAIVTIDPSAPSNGLVQVVLTDTIYEAEGSPGETVIIDFVVNDTQAPILARVDLGNVNDTGSQYTRFSEIIIQDIAKITDGRITTMEEVLALQDLDKAYIEVSVEGSVPGVYVTRRISARTLTGAVDELIDRREYIAEEGQTSFDVIYSETPDVFVNGSAISQGDFVAATGLSVTFNTGIPAGTPVILVGRSAVSAGNLPESLKVIGDDLTDLKQDFDVQKANADEAMLDLTLSMVSSNARFLSAIVANSRAILEDV